MLTVNKVIMIGHVAAEPEVRETKNGTMVANFPLATDRRSKDHENVPADYHKVVAWGRAAEICKQHVVKGVGLYIEGRLQNRSFEIEGGARRYITEIVLESLNILTPKKGAEAAQVSLEGVDPLEAFSQQGASASRPKAGVKGMR